MDIFSLLKINLDVDTKTLKKKYYERLTALHPIKNKGNTLQEYLHLTEAYKKHLIGEDFINCYEIINKKELNKKCRCGGIYEINKEGKIECDYCSCYIYYEKINSIE